MREYMPDDYPMISTWLCMRDKPSVPEWAFPETGIIVDNVACGFLIQTNNNCGILDFFISNPLANIKVRKKAFDAIVKELTHSASAVGLHTLFATTQHNSIEKLAFKHGFEYQGDFKSFKKDL